MTSQKTISVPLVPLTLGYLALPLVIFFSAWLKPGFAILAIASLLFAGWRLLLEWPKDSSVFPLRDVGIVILLSFALTAFMGIGAFVYQDYDWIKHNAVLFDCVNLPWPVVLSEDSHRWPLVYYLAYYLPAALVGKIGGYEAAQVALWIWSAFGTTLVALWFARLTSLPASIAIVAFFLFSGLDFFANLLVQFTGLNGRHDPFSFFPSQSWSKIWQFPSSYWALQWSPGPALAAWMGAGLFLASPVPLRFLSFAILFTCTVFWSPFAAIGLALLAFFLLMRERPSLSMKQLLPLAALAVTLGVLAVFFASKVSSSVTARFGKIPITCFYQFHSAPDPIRSAILLPLFILSEFGIFILLFWLGFSKGTTERKLAIASGLALVCLLPVTMGYYDDLALRGAAAPVFCLAVLAVQAIRSAQFPARIRLWVWLIILLGAVTPLIQAARQGHNLLIARHDLDTTPHQVPAVLNMSADDFFKAQYVGSTNSFFSRYLARPE